MSAQEQEHDHGHEHPHYQAHHFYTMEQQNASNKLGMWAFLIQELLFFAGLFMAYIAARFLYPGTFESVQERNLLSIPMGGLNTIVLLTSSLTMALCSHAVRTVLFACIFIVDRFSLHSLAGC